MAPAVVASSAPRCWRRFSRAAAGRTACSPDCGWAMPRAMMRRSMRSTTSAPWGRRPPSSCPSSTTPTTSAASPRRPPSPNATSDSYAMGADPLMAIAILGWPVNGLPAEVARTVVDGGRAACAAAGIALAGGHSIDAPEPFFGLAVTGVVEKRHLKRNDTATAGCRLYLTKPLGIGILTTAEKQSRLRPQDAGLARDLMCTLSRPGSRFGRLAGVQAMTDVTGFGLLGHLLEMAEGSGLTAVLDAAAVPRLAGIGHYLDQGCVPG